MHDVFISYSRSDNQPPPPDINGFVTRLCAALEGKGFDVWFDKQDINPAAPFQNDIDKALINSHAFLLVLSPRSVSSPNCAKEIQLALDTHKRLIPVMRLETDANTGESIQVPKEFAPLDWIFAREEPEFNNAIERISTAIKSGDLEYIYEHTHLQASAQRWADKQRVNDFLLRRGDLRAAEEWQVESLTGIEPYPTPLQVEYIHASRRAATAFQRVVTLLSSLGLIVMTVLAVVAVLYANLSNTNAQIAERGAAESHSEALGLYAQQAFANRNPLLALPLALAANAIPNPPPQAQLALANVAYSPGIRRIFTTDSTAMDHVTFSPDGKTALSGGCREAKTVSLCPEGELILWDVQTGQVLRTFAGHSDTVWDIAFSHDGKTALSASFDGTLILWDMQPSSSTYGTAIRTFEKQPYPPHTVAFSPDDKTALSGGCGGDISGSCNLGKLILWDMDTGAILHTFLGHKFAVTKVAFSPDGTTALSTSQDNTLILWDVAPTSPTFGNSLHTFTGHRFPVNAVAFSPDGKTALSGSEDHTLILWDLVASSPTFGKALRTFIGHTDWISSVAFSPDGKTALSASDDHTLILWDIANGQALHTFTGPIDRVYNAVFSPDGKSVLSGSCVEQDSEETCIRAELILWDIDNGDIFHTFAKQPDSLLAAAFTSDGKIILSASREGNITLWDAVPSSLTFGQPLKAFSAGGYIDAVAFSPDGKTAVTFLFDQYSLALWDLVPSSPTFGQIVRTIDFSAGLAVAFSSDGGKILVASQDGDVALWNLADPSSTAESIGFFRYFEAPSSVAFSPDSKTALLNTGDTAVLWDIDGASSAPATEVGRFRQDASPVNSVAFTPDGKTVLTASDDHTLILWDIASGHSIRIFTGHNGPVQTAAVSSDGKSILSASCTNFDFSVCTQGEIILWDVATGQPLRAFPEYFGTVNSFAFSPDGKTALAASSDGTLTLWRIDTLDQLIQWTYANRPVSELTCGDRAVYNVEPLCDLKGSFPTRTPYLAWTPSPTTPTTPIVNLRQTTAPPIVIFTQSVTSETSSS